MIVGILLADTDLRSGGQPIALRRAESGESLLEWQIAELRSGGAEVVEVVIGPAAGALLALISGDDVEPIINDMWQSGEASSLRVGATATPRNTTAAVFVWLARPRDVSVIRRVLDEHLAAGAAVTRPMVGGIPGSPVVVDAAVLARVRNIADGVPVEDVLRDYDTLIVRFGEAMPDLTQ